MKYQKSLFALTSQFLLEKRKQSMSNSHVTLVHGGNSVNDVLLCFVLEIGFGYVAQARLKILGSRDLPPQPPKELRRHAPVVILLTLIKYITHTHNIIHIYSRIHVDENRAGKTTHNYENRKRVGSWSQPQHILLLFLHAVIYKTAA